MRAGPVSSLKQRTIAPILLAALCASGTALEQPGGAPVGYSGGSIIGREKSRYADRSSFWEIAETVKREAPSTSAPGFRFAWGDRRWHAEGAVAMAATVALQRFVGLSETHRVFCSGEPNCNMVDFETRQPDAGFTVRRLLAAPGEGERKRAIARCEAVFPTFRALLKSSIASSKGIVVAVYRAGAFARGGDEVENDSIHIFAMYGLDDRDGILLRDAADRVPVTYRLRSGSECEALTIPRGFSVSHAASHYGDWALSAWVVELKSPGAIPVPRPPVQPPIPGPPPSIADADVPGTVGQDPFDLGAFRLPPQESPANRFLYPMSGAPSRLQLRTGVAAASGSDSQRDLSRIEDAWGIARIGESVFYRPRPGESDPFSDAYRLVGKSERPGLSGLIRKFDIAARRLNKDRVWLATSVIRFVQNIPYELVPEDPLGIRAPVSVLSRNGGDCDSKSLLAAILLRMLGFQTIVLTNERLSHAVLGVELPVSAGAYVEHRGRRFVLVECTNPFPIGDLSFSGTQGDARRSGWEVHDVEI